MRICLIIVRPVLGCQRGGIENANGRLRCDLPRTTSLNEYTPTHADIAVSGVVGPRGFRLLVFSGSDQSAPSPRRSTAAVARARSELPHAESRAH